MLIYDAFLSYSSKDLEFAAQLVEELEKQEVYGFRNLKIWIDETGITPGEVITSGIHKGIRQAKHLLVLVSENSSESEWMEMEHQIAEHEDPGNRSRTVIPLLFKGATLPDPVKRLKAIHAEKAVTEKLVAEIVDAISRR